MSAVLLACDFLLWHSRLLNLPLCVRLAHGPPPPALRHTSIILGALKGIRQDLV